MVIDPLFLFLFDLLFVIFLLIDIRSAKKNKVGKSTVAVLVVLNAMTAAILLLSHFEFRTVMPSDLLTKVIGPPIQSWFKELSKIGKI